jgi:hypothetical protein
VGVGLPRRPRLHRDAGGSLLAGFIGKQQPNHVGDAEDLGDVADAGPASAAATASAVEPTCQNASAPPEWIRATVAAVGSPQTMSITRDCDAASSRGGDHAEAACLADRQGEFRRADTTAHRGKLERNTPADELGERACHDVILPIRTIIPSALCRLLAT